MSVFSGIAISAAERSLLTDSMIRSGIRKLCRQRIKEFPAPKERDAWISKTVKSMCESRIAEVPELANEQHYEVPSAFFLASLGTHLKYSCCLWEEGDDLEAAEQRSLIATCEHADLRDGQRILELGCGWGSLSLWMAEQYPEAQITSVSNSHSQKKYIDGQAKDRNLNNLTVVTMDVNEFETDQRFDRLVSVEMFEHVRNWDAILKRLRGWLHDDGKALIHVFCHRDTPYFFEARNANDWMASEFFSGGLMPSADLMNYFNADMSVSERWTWNGSHYARTAEAWLDTLDENRGACLESLQGHASIPASRAIQRWRIFYMACAELFGMNNGDEWMVCHYLLEPATAR